MEPQQQRQRGPVPALEAVILIVASVALSALVALAVNSWEGTYGDQAARWPGPGILVLGIVIAIPVALLMTRAARLLGGRPWVRALCAAVVIGVLLTPFVARKIDIERLRTARASEQVTIVNRAEQLAPGVAESADRIEAVIAELALGAETGPVLEGGGGRAVIGILATDTAAALSAYRQRLAGAGWVVTSSPGAASLEASREPLRLEMARDDNGSLTLTVTDDAYTPEPQAS